MADSVRPHRWQPTRLPRPWDSPGKNTGVGYHSLLQCMKVKSESEVAQLCPTLSDPMGCSLPGSSIHGILQARVPEWGAVAFSSPSLPISNSKMPASFLFRLPHYQTWTLWSAMLVNSYISLSSISLDQVPRLSMVGGEKNLKAYLLLLKKHTL